jgi:hypothetical protein
MHVVTTTRLLASPASTARRIAHHAVAGLRVQAGRRLVGEDELRAVGKCPGDGHALLFAAAEVSGPEARPVLELEQFEQAAGAAVCGITRDAGEVQRDLDILADIE